MLKGTYPSSERSCGFQVTAVQYRIQKDMVKAAFFCTTSMAARNGGTGYVI